MIEVIGIRFKDVGKIYYFTTGGKKVENQDNVIVETVRGVELGKVVLVNKKIEENEVPTPLKEIIRVATNEDIQTDNQNKKMQKEAFDICAEKIKKHKLIMKLIDVEYTFDRNKILFYFTADGRVDFRELVKDLASVFRTRIELRQIGVRDEAKFLGGLGVCGKEFCCSSFLGEFEPVSIKMAKEQSLSLNPTKISGTCGRLMCCLKYEQDGYEELFKVIPRVGAYVDSPDGKGYVIDVNALTGILRVKLDDNNIPIPKSYFKDELVLLRDAEVTIDPRELKELSGLE